MKVIRTQNFKADLLAKIAPTGFNAHSFANDLRMVKMPTPGRPAARIMMNDGGWIEINPSGNSVRTWGPSGRAQVLAGTIASLMGVEVEHLMKTVSVGADAEARKITKMSEDKIKALAMWWSARGYVGIAGPDGCWVDVGNARILDTGAELEIHGGVTDEAVNAVLLKARDAWKGNITLDGHWTQAEQDRLWIAAQRQGITVQNCRPSQTIQTTWRREQDAAAKSIRTISGVRTEMVDAQDLIAAQRATRIQSSGCRAIFKPSSRFTSTTTRENFLRLNRSRTSSRNWSGFARQAPPSLKLGSGRPAANSRHPVRTTKSAPTKTGWKCDDCSASYLAPIRHRASFWKNAAPRVGLLCAGSRSLDQNGRDVRPPARASSTHSHRRPRVVRRSRPSDVRCRRHAIANFLHDSFRRRLAAPCRRRAGASQALPT